MVSGARLCGTTVPASWSTRRRGSAQPTRELGTAAFVAAIGALPGRTPEELCGVADEAWTEPFVPTGIVDSPPLTETEESAKLVHLLMARSGVYIPALGETPGMAERRPERGSHEPGTFWYYNNWDFNVLGTIFVRETGEEIGDAFDRRIAQPIGMEHFEPDDVTYTYGRGSTVHPRYAFRMSARDFARYGQLFLQEGEWGGREVIPAKWVRESTRTYSELEEQPGLGYGYMWWTLAQDALGKQWPAGMYHAAGFGSQYLHVIPELNTVVVHFSNTYAGTAELVDDRVAFEIVAELIEARLE